MQIYRVGENEPTKNYPNPTKEQLESQQFQAVWNLIKSWDINAPEYDGEGMYQGANGSHVALILDALEESGENV